MQVLLRSHGLIIPWSPQFTKAVQNLIEKINYVQKHNIIEDSDTMLFATCGKWVGKRWFIRTLFGKTQFDICQI